MLIDATSLAIINHLKDGRTSYKKIAEDLGLAEGTVRSRVKKLMDEGVLSISGLVNPEALPDQQIIMVGVRIKGMDLVKKGEEFSKLRLI
jgi:Lrp/AsnC family transcriptional regulator for asnA, asnC and gidA